MPYDHCRVLQDGWAENAGLDEFHVCSLIIDEEHGDHYGSKKQIAIDHILECQLHDPVSIVLAQLDLKHGKAPFVWFYKLTNEVKACYV